jgi:hypothetical protein
MAGGEMGGEKLTDERRTAMTRTQVILIATIQLVSTGLCHAVVFGNDKLDINFSQPQDASQKADWCMPGHPSSQPAEDAEHPYPAWLRGPVWIHTKPLAIGDRHRAPTGVSVHVEMQPPASEHTFRGTTIPPDSGTLYIRYSPDGRHWSSWQTLQAGDDHPESTGATGRLFSGRVSVP